MDEQTKQSIIRLIHREVIPAIGCTEPIAVALACAKAAEVLGDRPERVEVYLSANILKNAMGVGIPGADEVGLEMAAAMGIVGGKSEAVLEVLSGISDEQIRAAKIFARESVITALKRTDKKLYIEVVLEKKDDSVTVIVEDSHTNITRILHGETVLYDRSHCDEIQEAECDTGELTVDSIYDFVCSVDVRKLQWLLPPA